MYNFVWKELEILFFIKTRSNKNDFDNFIIQGNGTLDKKSPLESILKQIGSEQLKPNCEANDIREIMEIDTSIDRENINHIQSKPNSIQEQNKENLQNSECINPFIKLGHQVHQGSSLSICFQSKKNPKKQIQLFEVNDHLSVTANAEILIASTESKNNMNVETQNSNNKNENLHQKIVHDNAEHDELNSTPKRRLTRLRLES